MNVGFVGTGTMGAPMLGNLVKKGFGVLAYDVVPAALANAETRGLKGPRTYEGTGMPFHKDNQTVVKERIFLDKNNPDALNDEITVIDHALTRPWTITKRYRRDHDSVRLEYNCSEDNHHVLIGGQDYFLSGDDLLMPSKKGQQPPDLRYFKETRK